MHFRRLVRSAPLRPCGESHCQTTLQLIVSCVFFFSTMSTTVWTKQHSCLYRRMSICVNNTSSVWICWRRSVQSCSFTCFIIFSPCLMCRCSYRADKGIP